MGYVLEANNLNQIEKDTLLFKKGEKVSFTGWIIKDEYTIFYSFPTCDMDSLQNFMSSNKEYLGIIIDSVTKEFADYLREQEHFLNRAIELYLFLQKHYETALEEGMRE